MLCGRLFYQAGLQGIMIEDQVAPKRCGHTKGKSVVSREEAYARVQAAVDARNEGRSSLLSHASSLFREWRASPELL